ncbi:CRISPR-associated helicase Cas3' [Testudinibacter sp. TR-2022]|uniref:CRISPR-associated helicase Cas3' n=1 Tax=Testudinibacter sp. TR-2022 TaxID=2585029 RepID=UPI001118FDC4|nr:CRISPR-associated helicase Cas3' [Testudinibacter sp. TR-2022]TNH06266.1 CRISPR-associated helicase Cas3' [Pasteurellaceae bacterium Phil11]TNH23779.1 CRISPR-associated helicase Cas3' [Testudinibacter sp. TR-2022]TNH24265.1 CRISPR-associated helicase Cas3' [Testudinibacter sp. TR-2022]
MCAFLAAHRKPINRNTNNTAEPVSYLTCLAKTRRLADGRCVAGRTILEHCIIVGEVAKRLLVQIPVPIRTALFPDGVELLAACHDIGKVSPRFQNKLRKALGCELTLNTDESAWDYHGGVTFLTLRPLIGEKAAAAAGQHHGSYPTKAKNGIVDPENAEVLGGAVYHQQRLKLIEALKQHFQCDFPELKNDQQLLAVSGLITVADWIGSGASFEDPAQDWRLYIESAVAEAGYLPLQFNSGLTFQDIFTFTPHLVQQQLIDSVQRNGCYVLEAPMGLGKTEAALYAAYSLLQRGDANGFYFALPTQLTSNKIYQRVNQFLEQIIQPQSAHREALLIHGTAWLQQFEMGEDAAVSGSWFNQKKRAVLAPFGVGTIDQILLSVMWVKHGFVRSFGLAGKVVVLDEIHSYDIYTGMLVQRLIAVLRELGCSVIILSATLTRQRRYELLGLPLEEATAQVQNEPYPMITAISGGQISTLAADSPSEHNIQLRYVKQSEAIEEALLRAEQGQQVLWIENSVAEAQETYRILAARCAGLAVKCGLLHSRFTAVDRHRHEQQWIDLFGKPGWQTQTTPIRLQQGRILIGTQVLEQSVDIDADFLISKFAPTDMLLQRLGRLWRHGSTPRVASARAEAWLLAPDLESAIDDPIKAFGTTAFVYAPYVLCRSLAVWQQRKQLTLPNDIRALLEATYFSCEEQGKLAQWKHELENGSRFRTGQKQMQKSALAAQMTFGMERNDNDDQVQTRFSEQDSFDILLLSKVRSLPEIKATELTLLDGTVIVLPVNGRSLPLQQQKRYAAQLMQQMVSINLSNAPKRQSVGNLAFLRDYCYLGQMKDKNTDAVMVVAIVAKDGRLQGDSTFHLELTKPLYYQPHLGLVVEHN